MWLAPMATKIDNNGADRWCQPLAPIIVAGNIIGDMGRWRSMFQPPVAPMIGANWRSLTPKEQNYWRQWPDWRQQLASDVLTIGENNFVHLHQ